MILPNHFVTFLTTTHSGVINTPELDAEKIAQWAANGGFGSLARAIMSWVEPRHDIQPIPSLDLIEKEDGWVTGGPNNRFQSARKRTLQMTNSSRGQKLFEVVPGGQLSQNSQLEKSLGKLYKGAPDMAGSNLQVAVILSPRPSGRATTALFSTLRSGDPFLVISQVVKNGKRNAEFERYILSNCNVSDEWECFAATYFHFISKLLTNSDVVNMRAQECLWKFIRQHDVPASILNSIATHYDVPEGIFDGKLNSVDICNYDLTNLIRSTKFSDDMDSLLYDAFKNIFDNKSILSHQQWLTKISNAQRFAIYCLGDERYSSLSFEKLTRLIAQETIADILVVNEDANALSRSRLSAKLFSNLLLRSPEGTREETLMGINRNIDLLNKGDNEGFSCFRAAGRPKYNFNNIIDFDGSISETMRHLHLFLDDFIKSPNSILHPALICNINLSLLNFSVVTDHNFKHKFNQACQLNKYLPTLITCATSAQLNGTDHREISALLRNLNALFGVIPRNLHLELAVSNFVSHCHLHNDKLVAATLCRDILKDYVTLTRCSKPHLMMAMSLNGGWDGLLTRVLNEVGLTCEINSSIEKIKDEINTIKWLGGSNTYVSEFIPCITNPMSNQPLSQLKDLNGEFLTVTSMLAQNVGRPSLNEPIQMCINDLTAPNGNARDIDKNPISLLELCNATRFSNEAMHSLRALYTCELTMLGLLEEIEQRHTGYSPGLNEAFEHYHQRYACQQVRVGKSM